MDVLEVELEEGVRARRELVGACRSHRAVHVAASDEFFQLVDAGDFKSTEIFNEDAALWVFLDLEGRLCVLEVRGGASAGEREFRRYLYYFLKSI